MIRRVGAVVIRKRARGERGTPRVCGSRRITRRNLVCTREVEIGIYRLVFCEEKKVSEHKGEDRKGEDERGRTEAAIQDNNTEMK